MLVEVAMVVRQFLIVFMLSFCVYAQEIPVLPDERIPEPTYVSVSSDEITLLNGDVLSGELLSVDKEFVHFRYGFLDKKVEIVIPRNEVMHLAVRHPVYIASSSGDVKLGIFESDPDKILSEVSTMTLKDPSAPPEPPRWHGELSFGVQGHGGNNDTLDATGSAEAKLEKDYSTYYVLMRLAHSSVDRVDTTENGFSKLKYKYWPYTSSGKIYLNTYTTNEYDYIQKLSLRTRLGAGLGYRCYKNDDNLLECEVGGAATREDLIDGLADKSFGSVRLGAFVAKQICEDIKLKNGLEVFPGLRDRDDFYIRNEFSVATDVNDVWQVTFHILLIHDNVPAREDLERTEWTTGLGLSRKF